MILSFKIRLFAEYLEQFRAFLRKLNLNYDENYEFLSRPRLAFWGLLVCGYWSTTGLFRNMKYRKVTCWSPSLWRNPPGAGSEGPLRWRDGERSAGSAGRRGGRDRHAILNLDALVFLLMRRHRHDAVVHLTSARAERRKPAAPLLLFSIEVSSWKRRCVILCPSGFNTLICKCPFSGFCSFLCCLDFTLCKLYVFV